MKGRFDMKEFYQMTEKDVRLQINGSMEPLTEEQIKENREKYGQMSWQKERKNPP